VQINQIPVLVGCGRPAFRRVALPRGV